MRFDEPDAREAYRRGARDLYEAAQHSFSKRQATSIEKWLDDLDEWHEFDPPPAPTIL